MPYYVYILESSYDENKYVGCTNNIKRRLEEHNSGKTISTKTRKPFKLIYCEVMLNKYDAYNREKFLKTGWGKNYIKRVIKNYETSKKLGG